MTIEELAAGLRGKALTDAIYEDTLGFPPSTPATERTPEERHASLEKFFAIMHSLSDEELNDTFMSDVRSAHKNSSPTIPATSPASARPFASKTG